MWEFPLWLKVKNLIYVILIYLVVFSSVPVEEQAEFKQLSDDIQELQQSLFCCSSTDALFCCLAQVLRIYFLSAFTAELASFLQFMPAFLTEKRIIRVNKHNCFLPLQHYHILARIASQFFLFPAKE